MNADRPLALYVAWRSFALSKSRLPLMEAMRERGWHVVGVGREDEYASRLRDVGFEFVGIGRDGVSGPFAAVREVASYWRIIRDRTPDLIHIFNARPVVIGAPLARMVSRAKIICTLTGLGRAVDRPFPLGAIARNAYKAAMASSHRVIFQNRGDAELLGRMVDGVRYHLIRGTGVDIDRFHPTKDDGRRRPPSVLMASRLLWSKGVREYVEAASHMKSRHPEYRFVLAGEAADSAREGATETWLRELGSRGVEYIGRVDDLERRLPGFDLLVHPTGYREGLPRILLEAGACGIPVIAGDVSGCREIVEDGVNGVLIPPCDAKQLEAAMDSLLDDPSRRRVMGRRAREIVAFEFSRDVVVGRHLAVYRTLELPVSEVTP